jgi:hypothetical protein
MTKTKTCGLCQDLLKKKMNSRKCVKKWTEKSNYPRGNQQAHDNIKKLPCQSDANFKIY